MTDKPTVLFICKHNAGRSQLGAALLELAADDRSTAASAGIAPAAEVNPSIAATVAELGLDISDRTPRKVTPELLDQADVVVLMKPGLDLPATPRGTVLQWSFPDRTPGPRRRPLHARRRRRPYPGRAPAPMTDSTTVTVRPMTAADWPAVEAIYREGIATGNATFEAEPPTWEAFDGGKLPEHRFVAVDGDEVLGWVAVSPTSARPVYRGRRRALRLRRRRSAWPRRRTSTPRRADRIDRGRRHLDHPVRDLPREHRLPRPPRRARLPRARRPRAHRTHDVRSVDRSVARQRSRRTPKPARRLLSRERRN